MCWCPLMFVEMTAYQDNWLAFKIKSCKFKHHSRLGDFLSAYTRAVKTCCSWVFLTRHEIKALCHSSSLRRFCIDFLKVGCLWPLQLTLTTGSDFNILSKISFVNCLLSSEKWNKNNGVSWKGNINEKQTLILYCIYIS